MEIDEIKSLIELLQDTDITELLVEREGSKVTIKKEKVIAQAEAAPAAPRHVPDAPAESKEAPSGNQNLVTVTSPIVGIFHRAPSPEASPFVEVGSHISKGQVLCIVEAMKLMNEIETDTNGTIAQILIENGQPVEYGEPLFLIDPAL